MSDVVADGFKAWWATVEGGIFFPDVVRHAVKVAFAAGVAAERERCAAIVESAIYTEVCGTIAEASEMCKLQCEMYGCSTLRELAASIRAHFHATLQTDGCERLGKLVTPEPPGKPG